MSEFEKGVPIPKITGRGQKLGYSDTFMFSKMEVGDSKPIPEGKEGSIHSCLRNYNKTHKTNMKIITRKDSDGVFWYWRVE